MMKLYLFCHFTTISIICMSSSDATPNIDKSLLRKFEKSPNGTKANIFAVMGSNAKVVDKINSMNFDSQEEQREQLHSDLKSHASQHQANVSRFLAAKKTLFESFWITNQIYIPGIDKNLVDQLSQFNEIEEIKEDELFQLDPIIIKSEEVDSSSLRENTVQWNIQQIRVDEVWKSNNIAPTGKGIRVAHIDTGVRWTHEALKENYIGAYGWFDPYDKKPGRNDTPYDVDGHGTHTMGTIAGSRGIGVAPGAKWMTCKLSQDNNWYSVRALISCFQFMLCPHLPDGSNLDCSKAPHVISNSWGFEQGRSDFFQIIETLKSAGIIVIFAQGNSGPECGTALSPGDYLNVIGVGANTKDKELAWFSSKGPTVVGNRIKPDISAPGHFVTSASYKGDNLYVAYSGTSMACPHVAGVVGLMQASSGKKKLDLKRIKDALCKQPNQNITKTGYNCGGVNDDKYPNNSFGCGIVDALMAVKNIIS